MNPRHSLRVVFLGSGSSGNATAVTDGETTVLVDCGFSAREISRRLDHACLHPTTVAAILVTHEHSDHVKGVDVFARRHAPGCTVFASEGTRRAAELTAAIETQVVRCGTQFAIGSLTVTPFCASHDAAEPLGYRFDAHGDSVGIVTDTGVLTPQAREALVGVKALGIESNHDARMLERGPYPAFLKRRIRSNAGHLSNDAAADALDQLASEELVQVFALHRSHTNNTAALAAAALTQRLARLGLEVPVHVVPQHESCDSCPPQGSLFEAGPR
jgi:phosphoribosyl 1,2-cyclic phosphodiesterase